MELALQAVCSFLGAVTGAALGIFIALRRHEHARTNSLPSQAEKPFLAIEETLPQRRPYHRAPQTEEEMRKIRGEELIST